MPSTLADIIMQGGRQRADSLRRSAEIEAQRRTNTANIWGGVIKGTGEIGAQAIQSIAQAPLIKAKAEETRKQTEILDLNLANAKDQAAQAKADKAATAARAAIIDAAWTKTPDGMWTLDQDKLIAGHRAAGLAYDPAKIKPYLDSIDQANTTAHTARTAYFGELAKFVSASGNTLESFTHAVDAAVRNSYVDPTEAAGLIKRATANPSAIPQITDALTGKAPEKLMERDPAKDLVSPTTGAIAQAGTPVAPKPPNSQSETFQLDGQTVKGDYLSGAAGQPGRYFYNGQDVTSRAKAVPTAAAVNLQLGTQAAGGTVDPSRPDPKLGNTVDPKVGLTPNSVYQSALTFALRGTLPVGSRSAATIPAQRAIQNKAGAIAEAAGVDLPLLKQEYDAASASTRALTQRYQLVSSSAQTANDNIAYALELSPNVSRTGAPKVNRFTQWFTSELGGKSLPNLSQFELAIYTAAREYAKVSTGSAASIAELSATASQKVDQLINAAQTPEQFKKVTETMQRDMANITGPLFQTIQNINDVGPNLKRFLEFTGGKSGGASKPMSAEDLIKKYGGK